MDGQKEGYKPSEEERAVAEEMLSPEQQAMSEQRESELRKLPPILLVYRDNDLFTKYVQSMTKTLGSLGRQVEIHNFPPDTDPEEIRRWARTSGDQVEGKILITDRTCYVFGPDAKPAETKGSYLDSIFEEASRQVVLGEDSEQKLRKSESEELAPSYRNILSRIIAKTKPTSVIILERNLRDHQFSDILDRLMSETLTEEEARTFKELEYNFHRTEAEEKFFDEISKKIRAQKLEQKALEEAGRLVKSWLVDAGVPDGNISTVESIMDIPDDFNQAGNWIIADRHALTPRKGDKNIVLNLPLANFIETAQGSGLLQFEPGELETAINEILKKDFSPKG